MKAALRHIFTAAAAVTLACTATAAAAQGTEPYLSINTDSLAFDDASASYSETVYEAPLANAAGDELDYPAEASATRRLVDLALPTTIDGFAPSRAPIAQAGPFFLTTADTIEMIGTVDSDSPAQFAALLAAHPGIRRLVMIECPGSIDEEANHRLARTLRRAGIATHVPAGGSVRSGAVELFLAGAQRSADPTAEFAVHSWRDEDGRQARDFAADDPVNAEYITFYRDMGLNEATARRFYALTNSVPFERMLTLSAAEMSGMGLTRISG